ncbi:MAG: hypothetical protein JJ974_00880 [Phycisphaerales bacterium]|nr:hypothetical protein [Phycisphaerales bacterium]
MRHVTPSLIVLCSLAGSAIASLALDHRAEFLNSSLDQAGFEGPSMTIDLSGMNSWDLQGDLSNEFTSLFLSGGFVTAIGWDVQIQTVGASWLSEVTIGIEDELFLTPGIGDDFAGTSSYSSGGLIDLVDLDLAFFVDGFSLDIEIFESFDDVNDEIDAVFGQGSVLYVQTVLTPPTPGTAGALAIAGLFISRRRRA